MENSLFSNQNALLTIQNMNLRVRFKIAGVDGFYKLFGHLNDLLSSSCENKRKISTANKTTLNTSDHQTTRRNYKEHQVPLVYTWKIQYSNSQKVMHSVK